MYINTYNLTGQAFIAALDHNNRQYNLDRASMLRNVPWRVGLRRLIGHLAVLRGSEWLDASVDVLEAWLPRGWAHLHHHELVTYLDVQGITPEHCILAD